MSSQNSAQLVLDSPRDTRRTSKQRILERIFFLWFDGLVYSQIWEDPRVDLEALELGPRSRILTISSAGCNALNYLIGGPASITAVDLNRHHIRLLDLKIAALRHLPDHESFFDFFGRGRGERNVRNYFRYIAPHLDGSARKFWERGRFPFFGSAGRTVGLFSKRGLFDRSRNGLFLRLFSAHARVLGCRPERVLSAAGRDEQERLFARHIEPVFDSILMRGLARLPVALFGLGIPPRQYDGLMKELGDEVRLIELFRSRVRKLATGFPISDNYFAWQAFGRKYDTERRVAVPDYLKVESYETLRARIGRIETRVSSVTAEIRRAGAGAYDRFVFLDALDWMEPEALAELWSAISFNAASGTRIIFRTAGRVSPVEAVLAPAIRNRFRYHSEESRQFFERDRSSIYGGFHLYSLGRDGGGR